MSNVRAFQRELEEMGVSPKSVEQRITEAVARERAACAKVAKRAMEDMKAAEHRPHPDDPYGEDKARGGWLTARAIWEDIRARTEEKTE